MVEFKGIFLMLLSDIPSSVLKNIVLIDSSNLEIICKLAGIDVSLDLIGNLFDLTNYNYDSFLSFPSIDDAPVSSFEIVLKLSAELNDFSISSFSSYLGDEYGIFDKEVDGGLLPVSNGSAKGLNLSCRELSLCSGAIQLSIALNYLKPKVVRSVLGTNLNQSDLEALQVRIKDMIDGLS